MTRNQDTPHAVEEWVVYGPPKSVSFGHHSVPRDPRKTWPTVEAFLRKLDHLELGHTVELICNEGGKWTDVAVAERRISEAQSVFGLALNPQDRNPRWKISASQLSVAIQFALDDDKYPKQQMGPTRLHFYYRFRWPEFEKRPYWTGKGDTRPRHSSLGVSVGGRSMFLQPTFVFPAPWHSELLREFITQVEERVPFRFRDQYFKRSLPPKKSGHGRLLKLPASWRTSDMPGLSQALG